MSVVTSKLQVTIPKVIADRYGIKAGSDIDFEPAGPVVVLRPGGRATQPSLSVRLAMFDETSAWLAARAAEAVEAARGRQEAVSSGRGWSRDELYERVDRIVEGSSRKG